jgi:hypothetical protein
MAGHILLVLLAFGGCAESRWPASLGAGNTGPLRGTMTGAEVDDVRAGQARLERVPDDDRPR